MGKNLFIGIVACVALGAAVWVTIVVVEDLETGTVVREQNEEISTSSESASAATTVETVQPVTIVASNLTIPWDIAFLPDGSMVVTERAGQVIHIESGATYPIEGVRHIGEGGLLGIALHPEYAENNYVYLYQTTETAAGLENRVVRYTYDGTTFAYDRAIIEGLPGARNHDGGRIAFGPDGYLYVTIGDAGNERSAQDTASLAGSILRVDAEGNVPDDNPFGNAIYSYGHRNPQGLTWDDRGQLWSTEHGRSGVLSGYDELNRIEIGANYGWPDSQGDQVEEGTVGPAAHSGARTTWAPASAQYYAGSVFFGGLRGETLYEAVLSGDRQSVVEVKEHFVGEFGRIRTVALGPDNFLYLTTSNQDGRGDPTTDDDRIIRVDPAQL